MPSIHRMRWNDVVDIMLVKAKFIICNSLASACSYFVHTGYLFFNKIISYFKKKKEKKKQYKLVNFVNEILHNYNPMSNKK